MRRLLLLTLLASAPAGAVAAQGKISIPVSLKELEQRARVDSNDAAAHYNLALGYWNEKRWDDVEASLRESLALDPRFALSRLALSRLPLARNPKVLEDLWSDDIAARDSARASMRLLDSEWRHAFMIDPLVDIKLMGATVRAGVSQWDIRDAFGETMQNYFQASIDCYEGRYADCEQRFDRVIRDFSAGTANLRVPDGVYFMKGLAAAHEGHFEAAAAAFRVLMSREEGTKKELEKEDLVRVPLQTNEYRFFVASFTHAAGNTVDAIGLYRAAVENDLGLYMAHVRLANIFEAQRDYPRAIAARTAAVNANPDDATLQLDLGTTLGKAGDFEAAEQAIRIATERIPRHAEAWFWLGLALEQQGKGAEARMAYERVVALAPSRLQARADAARNRMVGLP